MSDCLLFRLKEATMIKNDWQLRVTQKRIKDFEDALFELERLPESESQPWLMAVQQESLESELKKLYYAKKYAGSS
jgi:hypothetical protein